MGEHALTLLALDDMNFSGKLKIYFDDYSEITDIVETIFYTMILELNPESQVKKLHNEDYKKLIKSILEKKEGVVLPSHHFILHGNKYWNKEIFDCEDFNWNLISEISSILKQKDFYAENYHNKYYIYVFAIDNSIGVLHSGMQRKRLLDWTKFGEKFNGKFSEEPILELLNDCW